MNEFELIQRYFDWPSPQIRLSVGDDCALLDALGTLAISTDSLIEGRHFFTEVDPYALGHKALAVNLSDLAAMGATPLAFTLALTLPLARAQDATWMHAFSAGLQTLATQYSCALIGGDTTAGPFSITITVIGRVDPEHTLKRSRAQVGDDIYVSGTLGDAALAVQQIQTGAAVDAALRKKLEQPTPRVALGQALLGIAHAAIDLSDGVAGDLAHVLKASGVGATLALEQLPLSSALQALPPEQRWQYALAGGDDYELCFTAPAHCAEALQSLATQLMLPLTCIGRIDNISGLRYTYRGQALEFTGQGFRHF